MDDLRTVKSTSVVVFTLTRIIDPEIPPTPLLSFTEG